jgi:N utilization substance protein B
MQTLYAYFQSENDNIANGERELLRSVDKIVEMFVTLLSIGVEVITFFDKEQENAKNKFLPTEENLNPNKILYNNFIYQFLIRNKEYNRKVHAYNIHWRNSQDLIRTLYNNLRNSEEYKEYISKEQSIEGDKKFFLMLLTNFISDNEVLISLLEEENVYWHDDYELVFVAITKFIKSLDQHANEFTMLPEMFKDPLDDRDFMINLFRQTIKNNADFDEMIAKYTKNWEVDRIAMMDILIMKMALSEAVYFNNIPIKVTLNEYIEISKNYSTPRSSIFINGNLDKMVTDMKLQGKIVKTGRGLIE